MTTNHISQRELALSVFEKAIALMEDGGWCKKGWAQRGGKGISLRESGPGDSFCLWGAMLKSMECYGFGVIVTTPVGNICSELIEKAILIEYPDLDIRIHPTNWNDNYCTSKDEALCVLEQAMDLAKERKWNDG